MRISALVLGLAGALTLAGCGGEDGGDQASNGPPVTCEQADPYTRGMEKAAPTVKVALLDANPAPPKVGEYNTWRLRVTDTSGAPLDGATIVVTGTMPQHNNHGSNVPVVVTPKGNGEYEISNLYLSMAGLWRIAIDVTAPPAGTDSVVFNFCV